MVGADRVSRERCAKNRDQLLRMGAVGMLVQAETADDLRIMADEMVSSLFLVGVGCAKMEVSINHRAERGGDHG